MRMTAMQKLTLTAILFTSIVLIGCGRPTVRSRIIDLPSSDGIGVTGFVFSPDGSVLAAVCYDQSVKFWENSTGEWLLSQVVDCTSADCGPIAFSADGTSLAVEDGLELHVLTNAGGEWRISQTLLVSNVGLFLVAFSPDGSRIVVADTEGARFLVKAGDRWTAGGPGPLQGERLLAISPDWSLMVTGNDNSSALWAAKGEDWEAVGTFELSPGYPILAATFAGGKPVLATLTMRHPDHRLSRIALFSKSGNEWLQSHISIRFQGFNSVAFSPDGLILAVGQENSILLYKRSRHSWLLDRTLSTDKGYICSIEFSPCGSFLAVCSKKGWLEELGLLDIPDGENRKN